MNYRAEVAASKIQRLIDALVNLFTRGKVNTEEIKSLKEKRSMLEKNNQDYAEISGDKRQHMKMYWRLLIILLGICIDFFLSFQSMTMLTEKYNMPVILKFFFPIFLIAVELGMSYFQSIKQRNGEQSSWVVRRAPYFVLIIMLGLSAYFVMYSFQTYNALVDHISFVTFFLSTLLIQTLLYIGSLIFHVWLISNAEEIAETFAHLHYSIEHKGISDKIYRLERKNSKKYQPQFSTGAPKVVQNIYSFHRQFPDVAIDFSKSMPADLIKAINLVMGKSVFTIENDNLIH